MAKSARSAAFRKIDVDQYNEENYEEEQLTDNVAAEPNISEVQSLLTKGKNVDALITMLSSPPLNTKNQAIKDKAFDMLIKVVASFKPSEIDGALNSLDQEKLEVLMKYIYRGFEKSSENNSIQFLVWFDKVYSKTGIGSILRVLTDRKRV